MAPPEVASLTLPVPSHQSWATVVAVELSAPDLPEVGVRPQALPWRRPSAAVGARSLWDTVNGRSSETLRKVLVAFGA